MTSVQQGLLRLEDERRRRDPSKRRKGNPMVKNRSRKPQKVAGMAFLLLALAALTSTQADSKSYLFSFDYDYTPDVTSIGVEKELANLVFVHDTIGIPDTTERYNWKRSRLTTTRDASQPRATAARLDEQLNSSSDPIHPIVQIASFFLNDDGTYEKQQLGSGVIIHSSGIILTNVHVIRDTELEGCIITKKAPLADLLVILGFDSARPGEPPRPQFAVDLHTANLSQVLPAEALQLDLAVIRINKRITGREPQNLEELIEAVKSNTLELTELDKPLHLPTLPLWDVTAIEEGQDIQLGGYPVVSPLPRLTFTEGPVLEKRADGTLLVDRAFATFGFSGGALIEKRSGFLIGILCGGQSIETPAGFLVLAMGRALDAQSRELQELFARVPEVQRHPVPRFTFMPEFPKPGEIITFNASASFDPDGQIAKFEWDFDGDGKSDAEGVKVQQVFSNDSRVTLIVTDNDGLQAQRAQRVILDRREQLRDTQQQCKPIQIRDRTFDTIQEAIDAAQPGETITVGPGICQENLRITKSLTLRGASRDQTTLLGDGQEPVIVVCPRKPTGESTCPQPIEVTIEGFTIRNGWHALQALANARVSVRESELTESVQQGVDVAFGAEITLIDNYISHNDEEGFVLEGGSAELQGNMITNNGDEGVLIKNLRTHDRFIAAKATLIENTLQGNREGAFITQQARVQIQGDQISQNKRNGLEADEQADLTILSVEILENHGDGMYLFNATAKIKGDSTISHNGANGIEIRGAAQGTLDSFTISENSQSGIELKGSGQFIIANAHIEGNNVGITIRDEARVRILHTVISDSHESGIYVNGHTLVIIQESTISNNGGNGIEAEPPSTTAVLNSVISDNVEDGILITGGLSAVSFFIILSSTIANNWDGIRISGLAVEAIVQDNRVIDNAWCGVWSTTWIDGSRNYMRSNGADLCGNAPAYLREPLVPQTSRDSLTVPTDYETIQEAVDAIAPGGTITVAPGIYEEGITIWKPLVLKGAGPGQTILKPNPGKHLILSLIPEAGQLDLLTGKETETVVRDLSIVNSNGSGAWIYANSIFENIVISNNGWDGVWVSGDLLLSPTVKFSDARIFNNWRFGLAAEAGVIQIKNSKIAGNEEGISMYSYLFSTPPSLELTDSQIIGNKYGIIFHSALIPFGPVEITNSRIAGNEEWGISLAGEDCGIFYEETFQGLIAGEDNEIDHNDRGDLCPSYDDPVWPMEFIKEPTIQLPEILDHTMAKGVLEDYPYTPIERTYNFSTEDEAAFSWIKFGRIDRSHIISWRWYQPNGDLYWRASIEIIDPRSQGYEWWEWYAVWDSIWIRDYKAAGLPGEWRVDVLVDGVPLLSEKFTIEASEEGSSGRILPSIGGITSRWSSRAFIRGAPASAARQPLKEH